METLDRGGRRMPSNSIFFQFGLSSRESAALRRAYREQGGWLDSSGVGHFPASQDKVLSLFIHWRLARSTSATSRAGVAPNWVST